MPRRILLVALAATLAAAADAPAAPTPAKLSVSSVSSPPRQITRGQTFTVTGRVRNRGRRSSAVLMSFSLRASARSRRAIGIGTARPARVRPGRTARYRARLRLAPNYGENRSYVLVACVRTKRGAKPTCRAARRRTLVRPGSPPAAPPANGRPPALVPTMPFGDDAKVVEPPAVDGARSLGDRLFPQIGNGGYDALNYDLAIDYTPASKRLDGVTTITAVATERLRSFSLDLSEWNGVTGVTVDGVDATFSHDATKLVITPTRAISKSQTFVTVVTYGGTQEPVIDPDGSSEGWIPTTDGAYVVNEPIGAQGWFPNNNHPTDKALYDIRVTVPEDVEVIGNGRLQSNTVADGKRTWHWREDSPMASYLTTATTGQFDITTDNDPALPEWNAIDSAYLAPQKAAATTNLQQNKAMLAWLADKWGPYPFTSTGGIVDRNTGAGYALESQTKPNYPSTTVTEDTYLHEHAHQWFGNSVSPATWSDIWLNEGPAEFNAWWWQEEERGNVAMGPEAQFDAKYATEGDDFWDVPPANPTPEELFDTDAMYERGAMVIQALREIMTEPVWLDMMRTWEDEHHFSHGSTADFIALVKRKGDPAKAARFDEFFAQWLYGTTKPTITPDTF